MPSDDRIIYGTLVRIGRRITHYSATTRITGRRRTPRRRQSPVVPRSIGQPGPETVHSVDGYGIPLGRILAGAHRHDSPLLAPTLDTLADLGPLPDNIVVRLDAGYDSGKTREESAGPDDRPDRAPGRQGSDPGQPALACRAHARLGHARFHRLQCGPERRKHVIDAFFDRWDTRPARRP